MALSEPGSETEHEVPALPLVIRKDLSQSVHPSLSSAAVFRLSGGPWRCPQDVSGDRDTIAVSLTPAGNSSVARGVPVTLILFLNTDATRRVGKWRFTEKLRWKLSPQDLNCVAERSLWFKLRTPFTGTEQPPELSGSFRTVGGPLVCRCFQGARPSRDT